MERQFSLGLPVTAGGVPLLPPATVARVAPAHTTVLVLPAAEGELAQRAAGQSQSFSAFVGLPSHRVAIVPHSPQAGNHASAPATNASLPTETASGRVALAPEQFAAVAVNIRASFVAGMHDALPCDQTPSRKRLMAETRTAAWAQAATAVFATKRAVPQLMPIRPAPPHPQENPKDAPVFAEGTDGMCGLSTGVGESPLDARRFLADVFARPAAKTMAIVSAHSLIALLDVLATVIDEAPTTRLIINCPFPLQLAMRGVAIQLPSGPTELPRLLDLWDPSLEEDTDCITKGCSCMPCRRHSRGYINHLLRVHEMNSGQLLFEHNLHAVQSVFTAASRLASRPSLTGPSRSQVMRMLLSGATEP